MTDMPVLRETLQFCLAEKDYDLVRYDFAYVDPASKAPFHYHVDTYMLASCNSEAARDDLLVPVARATITSLLMRKCGVALAIANQVNLKLPRGVIARYV